MGAELSREEDVGDDVPSETLHERSVDAVAKYLKDSATNIVVLTGAGISTSAGIPDFRSPETGLYANLERLGLPYAEAVFDIAYFRNNPDPFYLLARELYPGKYVPTISHAFIALLSKKNKLRMLFTQNIDCLERAADIPPNLIIEAHGSFATQRCIECKTEYPKDLMMKAIENSEVPHCSENPHPGKPDAQCNGLVKPDIVFFGEQLPAAFYTNLDIPKSADLMLIIGTSLTVHPFAALPEYAQEGVPRVLFNMEKVGGLGSRADDVCVLGPCDEGIWKLADALGWTAELEELWVGMGGKKGGSNKDSDDLDDKIDQITKDFEKATLNSEKATPSPKKATLNSVPWLEEHLAEKQQKGPSSLLDETITDLGSTSADPIEDNNATSSSGSSEPVAGVDVQDDQHEKEIPREPLNSAPLDTTPKATLQQQSNSLPNIDAISHDVDKKQTAEDSPKSEDPDLPKPYPKSNI